MIGPADYLDGLQAWLERCREPISAKDERYPRLFPSFPDCDTDCGLGTTLMFSQRNTRTISDRDLRAISNASRAKALMTALDVYAGEIVGAGRRERRRCAADRPARATAGHNSAQDLHDLGFRGCDRWRSETVRRLRVSERNMGEVTGYSVGLASHTNRDGGVVWYGGGKPAADLTLPMLRRRWSPRNAARQPSASRRITATERTAAYEHAAREARAATAHVRRCSASDPGRGTDAAWATADALHMVARMLPNPALRRAADAYDRAARVRYGRIPGCTYEGDRLRLLARRLAALGPVAGTGYDGLVASLAMLTAAVADLRLAQQHAAQAAAARRAADPHQMPRRGSSFRPGPRRARPPPSWPGDPPPEPAATCRLMTNDLQASPSE